MIVLIFLNYSKDPPFTLHAGFRDCFGFWETSDVWCKSNITVIQSVHDARYGNQLKYSK